MSGILLIEALAASLLLAAGTYLMLSWNVQRITIGFLMFSNGINMGVLVASGLPQGAMSPIIYDGDGGPMTDPLPQAFVLTAIVISLGTAAFLLAMATRTFLVSGRDDLRSRDES